MNSLFSIFLLLSFMVIIYLIIILKRKNIKSQSGSENIQYEIIRLKKKLFNEIIDREKENSLKSKEIHDQIGSSLTAIKMSIIHMKIDDEDRKLLNESIKELSIDIRRISNDLIPSILEMLGFQKALVDFCNRMNERTKIKFEYHSLKNPEQFNFEKNTQLALYRITEEICYCILQNSGSKNIHLIEEMTNETYLLTIEYDDIQFNLKDILKENKYDIISDKIHSRLDMIEGKIKFNLKTNSINSLQIELKSHAKD